MDDHIRMCVYSILFTMLFYAVLTECSVSKVRVSADVNCALNEEADENGVCQCKPCYAKDSDGKCSLCTPDCREHTDANGKLICLPKDEIEKQSKDSKKVSNVPPVKEEDMFLLNSAFDSTGFALENPEKYGSEERTPGFYPDYENYRHVPYETLENVENGLMEGALNFDDVNILPTLVQMQNPGHTKRGINFFDSIAENNVAADSSVNLPFNKFKEELNPDPQPEILDEVQLSTHASDYAYGSLGMKGFSNNQLTTFATGDVQTGFKPITSVMRPITYPAPTKQSEIENVYVPGNTVNYNKYNTELGETYVSKMDEREGRTPYADSFVGPETSLYWQSQIPERDAMGIDETEIWQIGNKLYQTGKEFNPRMTEFRNAREPIIPNTVGNGFYGTMLHPIDDISNKDKFFYASNLFDEGGMRDTTGRMTRDDDIVLAEPRQGNPVIDAPFSRFDEIDRHTSVKVQNEKQGKNILSKPHFEDRLDVSYPTRDQSMSTSRQLIELPGRDFLRMQVPEAFDRNEIVAAGPPVF